LTQVSWQDTACYARSSKVILESEWKPVVKGRPTLFVNFTHPSVRHDEVHCKAVSSFISGRYRRSLKSLEPTKPPPVGFHKRDHQPSAEREASADSEIKLIDMTSLAWDRSAPLRNVSGGLRTDPFDALPLKGNYAVSLALGCCKFSFPEAILCL
jgi:hypothetical protein